MESQQPNEVELTSRPDSDPDLVLNPEPELNPAPEPGPDPVPAGLPREEPAGTESTDPPPSGAPKPRRSLLTPWRSARTLTPAQRHRRRFVGVSTLAVALAFGGVVGHSVYGAMAAPGTDSTSARLAEWGRDHGLNSVIDWLEVHTYTPPRSGGAPSQADLDRMLAAEGAAKRARMAAAVPLHSPIEPLASPALPGEGYFAPLVTVKGQPVVQTALMRPDTTYTSFPVGIAWMKQSALAFQLHPGFEEPGGNWSVPSTIPPGERTGLVASYNGGFKVSNGDSHGGFYLDGRTVGTLTDGAASEVFYRNGSVKVGTWGQDVTMTPDVVGVRQCLVPLVAHGQVTAAVDNGGTETWGLTDQGMPLVPRSGIGIDSQGNLIYVGGRVLSVHTLATVLQRAGAVTAMMLDINLSWPSFISYDSSADPSDPTPSNLVNFVRGPGRYYDQSSRDFVAVYARP